MKEHNSADYRSHCPINFVLETFGDKWTLLIIRDLMFKGKRYYGDFLASDEKISTNILANRLQRLESNGVIEKRQDPDNHAKFIYSLTQKGKYLLPVMLEITIWSGKYDRYTNTPDGFLEQIRDNRTAISAQILSDLE